MKLLLSSLFLTSLSAFQIDGRNYNTFERIKRSDNDDAIYGVTRNVLTGEQKFITRTTNEGSGTNAIFGSQFSVQEVTQGRNPHLEQWDDDLLDSSSSKFQDALQNAIEVLQGVLDRVMANLGISSYEFVVLGFSQGSVIIEYELSLDVEEIEAAEAQHAPEENFVFNSTVLQEETIAVAEDPVVQQEVGIIANTTEIVVDGGDSGTGVIEDYNGACPPCWVMDQGYCIPDPSMIVLTCNADGMEMRIRRCVMGSTEVELLGLDDSSCNRDSGNIRGDGSDYVVNVGLDSCSTQMTFGSGVVNFKNHLIGGTDINSVISTVDRYTIEFACDYLTTYNDVSSTSEVTASINGGGTGGTGSLSFEINTYTDDTYTTVDTSGTIQVGTTLYFGVAMTSPINNLIFTVTDCLVKSGTGVDSLEYAIMTDRCPNTRVDFLIAENSDASLNRFSYRVFNFKNAEDDNLNLTCNVVVCSAVDGSSTCQSTPVCTRRRKRSLNSLDRIGETYFNAATSIRVR